MENQALTVRSNYTDRSFSIRNLLTIGFLHRRVVVLSFLGVFTGAVLFAVLQPNRYEATMRFLVKRDRVDPVVTPATNVAQVNPDVREEELNSEVELIQSSELLEKIVVTYGLQHQKSSLSAIISNLFSPSHQSKPNIASNENRKQWPDEKSGASAVMQPSDIQAASALPPPLLQDAEEQVLIARATKKLQKTVKVAPVKKTDLIEVTYESKDPQLAARVLSTLANLYLQKHVLVHSQPGAGDFFEQQTKQNQDALSQAEATLKDFTQHSGVVSAPLEKEVAVQKLADLQVILNQTNASITETEQRIRVLENEAASTPTRMVTQVRDSDDGALLSQIRSNLLTLEQKRIELLGKFEPTYRSVQEIDKEIAQARSALATAEKSKLHDETTDRDPTHEWVISELAKARADVAGLRARAETVAVSLQSYEDKVRSLGEKEITEQNLVRNVKSAEENYLLYLHKQQEARASEALDRGRILNVSIAEAATVPTLPANHRGLIVIFGFLLALFISGGLAFASESMDSTFRTPHEVESLLETPVLAAIPHNGGLAPRKLLE